MIGIKAFFFIVLFSFTAIIGKAQGLGASKDKIIAKRGYNFQNGTTKTGVKYIVYKGDVELSSTCFYFDDDNTCTLVMMIHPKSEANALISMFNKNYVKLSEGDIIKYKDYESGSLFDVHFTEDFMTVEIHNE